MAYIVPNRTTDAGKPNPRDVIKNPVFERCAKDSTLSRSNNVYFYVDLKMDTTWTSGRDPGVSDSTKDCFGVGEEAGGCQRRLRGEGSSFLRHLRFAAGAPGR
jgi:hypothetical protein